MPRKKPNSAQKTPKQPTIYRQKRRDGRDTTFTVIDGQRIHLGVFGTPEAEKEYRRVVAEYNTGIIAPTKKHTADTTIAELVLRFLKERKSKVSHSQWDNHHQTRSRRVSYKLVSGLLAIPRSCAEQIGATKT